MPIVGSIGSGHGVERIADEIDHHLFELHRIAGHPEVGFDILLDAHAGRL